MNRHQKLGFSLTLIVLILPFFSIPNSVDPLPISNTNQIRVLNYNAHFGVEVNRGYDLEAFIDVVQKYSPNIVTFQELTYYFHANGFPNMIGQLKDAMKAIGFEYSYISEGGLYYLRNAIFSQYPIIHAETIEYTTQLTYTRSFISVLTKINGYDTRVITTHLTHIGESTPERISQVTQLLDYIGSLNEINVILTGDFNAEPNYQEIQLIIPDLTDAWDFTNPDSLGLTSPSDNPEKRIDYIFLSSNIEINGCVIGSDLVSDHLPLYCEVVLST